MPILESACLVIVATYIVFRARQGWAAGESVVPFLTRFVALALAGLAGEESMIRLYKFYAYDVRWSVHLGHVPLVVVLIWPVVIDSARSVARYLVAPTGRARFARVAITAAVIVLSDAALIEPLAVRAGLWAWMEPGLFAVPVIGILGWAIFALFAVAWLERGLPTFGLVIVAPIATHAVLLAAWWCAFKWGRGPVPVGLAISLLWLASLAAARRAWRRRVRERVPPRELLIRMPAAIFFFVLLGRHARGAVGARVVLLDERGWDLPIIPRSDDGWLVVLYALGFAAPYLVSIGWDKALHYRTLSNDERQPL